MFEKDYIFKGKHAEYVEKLKEKITNDKYSIFNSLMDIFLIAPIIGYLDNKKSPIDKSLVFEKSIFANEMRKISSEVIYLYQLITLNDINTEKNLEKRIEKAFKNLEKEDFEVFEEYLRGGIEILYEKIYLKNFTVEQQSIKLLEFIEKFNYLKNIDEMDVTKIG